MEAHKRKIKHDVPPFLRVYDDGTVERLVGTETTPPTDPDPRTGVFSKDVVLFPETGVWARLYRPDLSPVRRSHKHPLVVYFHGGALCISSAADPVYHRMLNILVKEARVVLVSVNYRRGPEAPIPTAYEDSWAALRWVAGGSDDWIRESADFRRVFLAGDSAGANISHHMAIRAAVEFSGLKISGIQMVHPYFRGEEAVGNEVDDPAMKSEEDEWWRFLCPSDKGCDDPWINPLVEEAPRLDGIACSKVLVCVAGKDFLRTRGRMYYRALVASGWAGKAELYETAGEDHVFHIINPDTDNAKKLIHKCAEFFNSTL